MAASTRRTIDAVAVEKTYLRPDNEGGARQTTKYKPARLALAETRSGAWSHPREPKLTGAGRFIRRQDTHGKLV